MASSQASEGDSGPRIGSLAFAVPAAVLLALGLTAWAAVSRFDALMASPFPTGIDGYFYPIQLRSLLESGQLYYPSSPLAIWWMAPAAWVSDPITGAKFGAALGTALGVLPAFYLGRRVGGDLVLGLLSAVLWATSAESFYLSAEFVKTGLGLTVAASYLCALLWMMDRPSARRIAIAALALIATALTHKQATALALLVTIAPALVFARKRGLSWRALGLALAAAVALLLALGLAMPERFLGARDAALLASLLTTVADFSVPVLDPGNGPALRFGHEALLAGLLGLALLALALVSRWLPASVSAAALAGLQKPPGTGQDRALALALAAIAVVIALPWIDVSDPQGLGFRLRLIAFMPLAVCAAALAGRALAGLTVLTRTALVLGFAFGWVGSRPPTTTEGMVSVQGHMQAALRAASDYVPEGDVIICPQRSLVFMATWYTGRPARLRPEPVPEQRRWRLLPSRLIHPALMKALAALRADPPAGLLLPIGLHPRHEDGVVLMPEATWQYLMAKLPPRLRAAYAEWRTI